MAYFERFRLELQRYHEGVHEVEPGVGPAELGAAERRLGRTLPTELAELYRSFDGMRLFVDTYTLFGTAEVTAEEDLLHLGETPEGPVYVDDDARVLSVDERGDRVVCGTTIERWLAATMVREGLLVGADGEWRDVFGDDGGLTSEVRRKRVRAGLKADPGAAAWHLEAAELAFEGGDLGAAGAALDQAVAVDGAAAGVWELLGQLHRRAGRHAEAAAALDRAQAATRDPRRRVERLAEVARAAMSGGQSERRAAAAAAAAGLEPGCAERMVAEAEARLSAGDLEGAQNLAQLAAAVGAPGVADAILKATRVRAALRPIQ